MNFRNKHQSDIPEADMIPMLNVMLGLMAYFIIATMTMASQSSFRLLLPEEVQESDIETADVELLVNEGPLIIEFDQAGRFIIEEAQLDNNKMVQQLKLYLMENKTDPVFFKPSQQQNYEKVLQTLAEMRKLGGDRISLVIDEVGGDKSQ